jgi:hypothetical protein
LAATKQTCFEKQAAFTQAEAELTQAQDQVEALEGLVKHYESQLTDCSEKEKLRAVLMKVFDLFNTFPPTQKPFGDSAVPKALW